MKPRTPEQNERVRKAHGRAVRKAIEIILQAASRSGGDGIDMTIMAESVMVGILGLSVAPDGYEDTVDIIAKRVKKRLAENRLMRMPVEGNA